MELCNFTYRARGTQKKEGEKSPMLTTFGNKKNNFSQRIVINKFCFSSREVTSMITLSLKSSTGKGWKKSISRMK